MLRRGSGLLVMVLAGCQPAPPAPPPHAATPVALASAFDPQKTGTIRGQVLWRGPRPAVAPFPVYSDPSYGPPLAQDHCRDNPNAPQLEPAGEGVVEAVIFLRQVAPAQARPWDHGAVCVEQRQAQLHVRQDRGDFRTGFVQRGQEVTLVSCDPFPHALRARGAAFFTLPFPAPPQPLRRRLEQRGLVELSSGAGYFWMRAYLFVDDHPYYTRSDAQGKFVLPQVPAGRYTLVCWHPNWQVAHYERDPETALIHRLTFCPPLEVVQEVTVVPGQTAWVQFTLSAAQFPRPPEALSGVGFSARAVCRPAAAPVNALAGAGLQKSD
jgi:hypothetical protein